MKFKLKNPMGQTYGYNNDLDEEFKQKYEAKWRSRFFKRMPTLFENEGPI